MVIRLLSLNFNVNYNYMNWVLYDYNKLENLKLFLKSIYGDINLQPLIKFNEKGKFADVGINILHKRELNGYTVVGYILVKKKEIHESSIELPKSSKKELSKFYKIAKKLKEKDLEEL